MIFDGFVGPTYKLTSVNAACQKTLNLIPEPLNAVGENVKYYFKDTPGYELFGTIQARIRGLWVANSRLFAVTYNKVYEVFSDGTSNIIGTIDIGTNYVGMTDNGFELVIATGSKGYVFNLSDSTFTEITGDGWRGSNVATFLNGRIYYVQPNSGIYFWSELYDAADIDPLNFATAEFSPDNLVTLFTSYQEVVGFGTNSIQVFYDTGDANLPLQTIQGAVIEYGCIAPYSVAKADNQVFFLGTDSRGGAVVYSLSGYQPQRISTYAIEQAMQRYDSIEDAVAYTYQEDGHTFYVLNFSGANTTWCYDASTALWHERGFLNAEGYIDRHKGNFHAYLWGKHLISDYLTGDIYNLSSQIYSDDGQERKHIRSFPHAVNEQKRIRFNSLQIDMETGVGNSNDPSPTCSLQWSNDGGHTYGNLHYAEVGAVGEYRKRVKFNRLGYARDRIFSFDVTGKVPVTLLAAYFNASGGTS